VIWRAGQLLAASRRSGVGVCDMTCTRHIVDRLLREDDGQDVVEYALLAAFVGIVGYLALTGIRTGVFNTYTSWQDPSSGVPSLWDPPAPGGN
jgi:Flp pilus assembly pilin Flp